MKDALKNNVKCINYALNLGKSIQKASIRKFLKDLNYCRNFINLSLNLNEIENVDIEMQNADFAQSMQNVQNLHNENTMHDMKKMKSFNIEMRIEKIINEKMKKIQSNLNQKLNQMMKLIQSRSKTTSRSNVQNS